LKDNAFDDVQQKSEEGDVRLLLSDYSWRVPAGHLESLHNFRGSATSGVDHPIWPWGWIVDYRLLAEAPTGSDSTLIRVMQPFFLTGEQGLQVGDFARRHTATGD
jgi:hypothetical protein